MTTQTERHGNILLPQDFLTQSPYWMFDPVTSSSLISQHTLLGVVVAGSGRSLVFVQPQQGQKRKERLSVAHQDGGGLRGGLRRSDRWDHVTIAHTLLHTDTVCL